MTLNGKGLSLRLGERLVLRSVDFRLEDGELLGLIGPNGAGKSSLLRIIAGLLPPLDGNLELDGRPLGDLSARERARVIGYLPQKSQAHWPVAVERLVELGRIPHLGNWQRPGESDRKRVREVMIQTDTLQFAERPFTALSGGEQARVLLARALASDPRLLLADEPVAALDPAHQMEIMQLLRRHCDQGGSAVVVLHDLALAAHFCDRLQLLHQGETLVSGTPAEVLTADHLERAFQLRLTNPERLFSLPWESAR